VYRALFLQSPYRNGPILLYEDRSSAIASLAPKYRRAGDDADIELARLMLVMLPERFHDAAHYAAE